MLVRGTSRRRFTSTEAQSRKNARQRLSYALSARESMPNRISSRSRLTVGNDSQVSTANVSGVTVEFRLQPLRDCLFCGAKLMQYESISFCCSKGEVMLAPTDMPSLLRSLFLGRDSRAQHFQTCVRTYNNTFAFSSIGVYNYDKSLCKRSRGIYTFKVQGQIYHFINDLVADGCPPRNLQLYFFDTDQQIENRIQATDRLDREVVAMLIEVMSGNPYAQFLTSVRDIANDSEFSILLRSDPSLDQRVYNTPSASQVAAIWIDNSSTLIEENRNIRVYTHGGGSRNIQYYYGCYDPLQYPLLFPHGEPGWHEGIGRRRQGTRSHQNYSVNDVSLNVGGVNSVDDLVSSEDRNFAQGRKKNSISCREYYAYKLQIRDGDQSMLLHSGRLLQQFIVDVYIKIETQRLDFYRKKQSDSRSDSFQGLVDSVDAGFVYGQDVGRRIILPASFIGGPRDMRKRYMDAMALVQRYGKPDIFLTMTCNPNWPEIKELLFHNDKAQDRPDLLARVFHSRLQELKNDIIRRKLFGEVAAYTYVIEFQKRGLPHAHFLLVLKSTARILSPAMCDQFISAEIPDKNVDPRLYELVKKHMIHGPCGVMNPQCPCMVTKKKQSVTKCKFNYPRPLSFETVFNREGSFPTYRRRPSPFTVNVRSYELDNSWVVPYNPHLLLKFDCHINVELCATIQSVKYLYKYVYKGHDKISFALKDAVQSEAIDEIKDYQNARWVSPPEAAWRIFSFPIAEIKPAVYQLQVHLENYHYVNFYGNSRLANIVSLDCFSKTMLTEFFIMNLYDQSAREMNLLYVEFPEYFVWYSNERQWRQRKRLEVIGRLVTVNPTEGERYYLRLLLMSIRGPTSFDSLKCINGYQAQTFREAAEKLGLLCGDVVITRCLDEAVLFQMPSSLRRLFATLLIFCDIGNPHLLWNQYKLHMSEDFMNTGLHTIREAEILVLGIIGDFLESMGKKLDDYCLVDIDMNVIHRERECRELIAEYNLGPDECDLLSIPRLNREQRHAFDIIMESVNQNSGAVYFVDGPGGTGKTFLYRCLLAAVRSKKWIALATATSGIAASILPGGRTAHSRFKLPIDGDEKFVCNIGKQSTDARLLREARLIIWDEASMANRNIVENLDITLRDIMSSDLIFGGKVMVFGGDFRQTLPIVKGGKKDDFISASLVKSPIIWPNVKRLTLVQNMRAEHDLQFAEFLMRVGNGTQQCLFGDSIRIPSDLLIKHTQQQSLLLELLSFVYPDYDFFRSDPYSMMDRAVLTTKNDIVNQINSLVLEKFPGQAHTYLSFDEPLDSKYLHCQDFLHTLSPSGLPPHLLILKKNCPVLLLRNLNPCEGLCNGTRLICDSFGENVISCFIAIGQHKGKHVLIPRIPLQTSKDDCSPIPFKRNQFPLKPCFAMTINKSQGQTLDVVGIYLKQPVFSHGQLYVALSRARTADSVRMVICDDYEDNLCSNVTENVVYQEILEYIS